MTERDAIYLGALLHDIGKFAWRAQELKQGDNHEKLGEEFIREHLGKCKAVSSMVEKVIDAANRKNNEIRRADYAAASERQNEGSKQTRRPLVSIFNRVTIGKAELPQQIGYYLPEKSGATIQMPNKLDQNIAIEQWKPNEQEMIARHQTLWQQFLVDVEKLREIEDFTAFIKTFHSLLEEYTTTICSAAYQSYPDINLYDHSRITAALAICGDECIVIKGDVSGIQNFIYNDIRDTANPAKTLRGRSFYISLLVDTIAEYCIEQLGLYPSNLLFNSGGHFQILAPNTTEVHEKIQRIEKKINTKLLKSFNGRLSLVMAWVEVASKTLMVEYHDVIHQLNEKLDEQKKKKFFFVADDVLLSPLQNSGDTAMENTMKDLGRELPLSTHILEVSYHSPIQHQDFILDFSEFSKAWIFVKDEQLYRGDVLGELKKQQIRYAVLHSLTTENFLEYNNQLHGLDYPLGFTRKYIGLHIPMKKENEREPMEFEDLAKQKCENYPLLGVLRMDVDSLGALFAVGLREENKEERQYTLSRIASLSRELTKFFTLHLNNLAREHNIYLVYSGGDDVFAVGSWVKILDFAKAIQHDFAKFVCNNNNITISAGIVVTKDSFPISTSALWAGEQEDKAKNVDANKGKVSVFDREVSWGQLDELLKWGEEILKIVKKDNHNENGEDKLPPTFIHNLLTQTKQCFDDKGKIVPHKVQRFSAWLHYAFARRKVDAKTIAENDKTFKVEFAKQMLEGKKEEKADIYKNFIIPASYVLLKTRTLSN